jgi:hypothetical protein
VRTEKGGSREGEDVGVKAMKKGWWSEMKGWNTSYPVSPRSCSRMSSEL